MDTSVLIKWFHHDGETEVEPSTALLEAHLRGDVAARIIDLAPYELGNVLGRSLGWTGRAVADQLDDVLALCGPPIAAEPTLLRRAAALMNRHRLTFYDAAWAGAADVLGIPLVSADRALVRAGLAESPTALVARLRLSGPTA